MTSNLGADILAASDMTDEGKVSDLTKSAVLDIVRRHFPPEFVNRIDDMVKFAFTSSFYCMKFCNLTKRIYFNNNIGRLQPPYSYGFKRYR
jgi:ATP-dependent Clp protease ATP-binding subunit ClpA